MLECCNIFQFFAVMLISNSNLLYDLQNRSFHLCHVNSMLLQLLLLTNIIVFFFTSSEWFGVSEILTSGFVGLITTTFFSLSDFVESSIDVSAGRVGRSFLSSFFSLEDASEVLVLSSFICTYIGRLYN